MVCIYYLIEMSFIDNILQNPLALIIGFNVLIAVAGIVMMLMKRLRVKHIVLYFSEGERLYESLSIDAVTSLSLFCVKRGLRFIRTGVSYKNRLGNEVIWLAKRGTGYLFDLAGSIITVDVPVLDANGKPVLNDDGTPLMTTEEKKVAKKLGTLWEGLTAILGEELVKEFSDEQKVKLMNPDILLTVELEGGSAPYSGLPKLDETDIKNENSSRMSNLMFSGIKDAMSEDWLRAGGLVGIGVALTLVAQQLGVL